MTWKDVYERAELAEGPDRELDALIIAKTIGAQLKPYPPSDDFGPKATWQFWSSDGRHFLGNESKFPVPELTKSVDAMISFIHSSLKGWTWMVRGRYAKLWMPDPPERFPNDFSSVRARTPALAMVSAYARAREEIEQPGKPYIKI